MLAPLADWDGFYSIVGSAAGTLIGLQFVVVTLLSGRPQPGSSEASDAFSSPTVVHFGEVLLIALLSHVPWSSIIAAAVVLGVVGFAGVVYLAIVLQRMRRQSEYNPVLEDWLFHFILPFVANAVVAGSAAAMPLFPHEALFGVAAAVVTLLFVAIHNAWDTASYIVHTVPARGAGAEEPDRR